MHCSVVFGVTLKLLVTNISSSLPAINTAAYYQWRVTSCEMVAVVHQRPCIQHITYCSVNTVRPDIGSESRFLPTPPAFDAPIRGFPSEYCYAVWHGKTRMVWLPNGEKILMLCLFVLTQSTNVTHTHTAWQHSIVRQKLKANVIKLDTIKYRNPKSLVSLYKSLDYCSTVWHPHFSKDKSLLDKVQHRFTRLFPHLRKRDFISWDYGP